MRAPDFEEFDRTMSVDCDEPNCGFSGAVDGLLVQITTTWAIEGEFQWDCPRCGAQHSDEMENDGCYD